jgi:hypothetical protein
MKCSECVKEGRTSFVYVGMSTVTAMYFPPFYDEQGVFHNHDGNTRTTSYNCSNGHLWVEAQEGMPCVCGWNSKATPKVVENKQ